MAIIGELRTLSERDVKFSASEVSEIIRQTTQVCRSEAVKIVLGCNGWSYTAIAQRLKEEL